MTNDSSLCCYLIAANTHVGDFNHLMQNRASTFTNTALETVIKIYLFISFIKHQLQQKLSMETFNQEQVKTALYNLQKPTIQQFPNEQAFGDSGKGKLPFDRQKPQTEPDLMVRKESERCTATMKIIYIQRQLKL